MALRTRIAAFLRGQHRSAWAAGLAAAIAAVGFFGWQIANPRCAIPTYQPQSGVVAYSRLLDEYHQSSFCLGHLGFILSIPCVMVSLLVLILAMVAAAVVPRKKGKNWTLTAVLGLAAVVLSCGFWWESILASRGTPMTPHQTIDLNGHVIHLVSVLYPDGGMDHLSDRITLYLFECDSSGEQCSPKEVYNDYDGRGHDWYRLEVDQKSRSITVWGYTSYDDDNNGVLLATADAPIGSFP